MDAFPLHSAGRILIADDEFASRRVLQQALTRAGYRVETAASGQDTLARLREDPYPFDVLVLDFEMPDLNGIEVCAAVRSEPNTARLPVIVLTGHSGEAAEVGCLEAGANDFVTKPVSVPALSARIQTQLRLQALATELQARNARLEQWQASHESDLNAARAVQQVVVPSRLPSTQDWLVAPFYRPLIQIGGDIWNWRRLEDGRWLAWIADATGHGVAAALYTSMITLIFGHASEEATSPAEVLVRVNEEFFSVFRGKAYFTAACLLFSPGGEMLHAGAGHPPVIVLRRGGECRALRSEGMLLGLRPTLKTGDAEETLRPGESALLYTDGLYSAEAPRGRLTHEDLIAAVGEVSSIGRDSFHDLQAVLQRRFGAAPVPTDDSTGVLVTYRPVPADG